jgi:cell division inhibitor SepF
MSSLHKLKAYFGMVPDDDYEQGYDGTDELAEGRYSEADRAPHYRNGRQPQSVREPAYAGAAAYDSAAYDSAAYVSSHAATTRLEPLGARAAGRRSPAAPAATPASAGHNSTRGSLAVDERAEPVRRHNPFGEDGHPLARITTLHPRTYSEARTIGERYREGNPVIMNLTEMSDPDAKRLVDFAAGLAFAMRGAIDKVTNKVFLLSPSDVAVSAEDKRRIVENGFYNQT